MSGHGLCKTSTFDSGNGGEETVELKEKYWGKDVNDDDDEKNRLTAKEISDLAKDVAFQYDRAAARIGAILLYMAILGVICYVLMCVSLFVNARALEAKYDRALCQNLQHHAVDVEKTTEWHAGNDSVRTKLRADVIEWYTKTVKVVGVECYSTDELIQKKYGKLDRPKDRPYSVLDASEYTGWGDTAELVLGICSVFVALPSSFVFMWGMCHCCITRPFDRVAWYWLDGPGSRKLFTEYCKAKCGDYDNEISRMGRELRETKEHLREALAILPLKLSLHVLKELEKFQERLKTTVISVDDHRDGPPQG